MGPEEVGVEAAMGSDQTRRTLDKFTHTFCLCWRKGVIWEVERRGKG